MTVEVQMAPAFRAGVPRPLFTMRRSGVVGYDASADGQRFLVSTPVDDASTAAAIVEWNWFEELKRRLAND